MDKITEFCIESGGDRPISKVLIANNGCCALKGIQSIKQWASETFDDDHAISFVILASEEDMESNMEYIKLADERIDVPGGSNKNNYANVPLIVDAAKRSKCGAVWIGWGHASENPLLPETLPKEGIKFLGPSHSAMWALGDKIASTIIAQSSGVNCVRWSGTGLTVLPEANGRITVPQDVFQSACIQSVNHCKEICSKIGYPLMIKASEGGGGKGIRAVHNDREVENAYIACKGECPNSPIFAMKLMPNCRHIEVQLLGDEKGNIISLRSRDCSIQRRCQKMIEEGPVRNIKVPVMREMEKAAVRLAYAVNYFSCGTVEYLYDNDTESYFFLELNPRLQVEHPVTEKICGVNLPSCQLMIGMGIPLYRIPDIRRLYGVDPKGTEPIDFANAEQLPPKCHTIGVRITSENAFADQSFQPTTGRITELSFAPPQNVWGYFSMRQQGAVHQYADSQFGHIFCSGNTREEARRAALAGLRTLSIKGEICTNYEFLATLMERKDFIDGRITTLWLEGIMRMTKSVPSNPHLSVVCACAYLLNCKWENQMMKYCEFASAGHVPSNSLLQTSFTDSLILNGQKYTVTGVKTGTDSWGLSLNGSILHVSIRKMVDGGTIVYLGEPSYKQVICYTQRDPNGIRIQIDGKTTTFTNDSDPTKLSSNVPGKLIRYLVEDGDTVSNDQDYAEVEVMKMHLMLKTQMSGVIRLGFTPGRYVTLGQVLATIEPDNAEKIEANVEFKGHWSDSVTGAEAADVSETIASRVERAIYELHALINGFDCPDDLPLRVSRAFDKLNALALWNCDVRLGALKLPFTTPPREDEEESFQGQMIYIFTQLLQSYYDVGTRWEGKNTQTVVKAARDDAYKTDDNKTRGKEIEKIFYMVFAHLGKRRHQTVRLILQKIEELNVGFNHFKVMLSKLASLQSDREAGVVLQARCMLQQLDQPSFEDKEKELHLKLNDIARSRGRDTHLFAELVKSTSYSDEMVVNAVKCANPTVQTIAIELYVRKSYCGSFLVSNVVPVHYCGNWNASWQCSPPTTQDSTHKTSKDGIVGAWSMVCLDTLEEDEADCDGEAHVPPSEVSAESVSYGFLATFATVDDLSNKFSEVVVGHFKPDARKQLKSVVEIIIFQCQGVDLLEIAQQQITKYKEEFLTKTHVERVTICGFMPRKPPLYYTFRRCYEFAEDPIYRMVPPTQAFQMELWRLRNYELQLYALPQHTSKVHLYYAKERSNVRKPGERLDPQFREKRFFVRVVLLQGDIVSSTTGVLERAYAEKLIVEALQALEIARADKHYESFGNHIFMNCPDVLTDMDEVVNIITKLHSTYGPRFKLSAVDEVEVKFRVKERNREKETTMRLFARNPTTFSLQIELFREQAEPNGRVFLQAVGVASWVA